MNVRGNKCSFVNCGKSRRDFTNLHQYKFPKDDSTSRKWILNSGNVKLLDLLPNSLNKRVVCMNHFDDRDFENAVTKKRLKRGAIPKSYDVLSTDSAKLSAIHQCESPTLPHPSSLSSNESPEHLKVLKPVKTYGLGSSLLSFTELPSTSRARHTPSPTISSDISPNSKVFIKSIVEMPEVAISTKKENLETTPRKRKLKSTIIHQRKLIKNKRSLIARLRKNREEQKRQFNFQYIIRNDTYKSRKRKLDILKGS